MVHGDETPLLGGNLSAVVRIGDTVRRPVHSWSPTVHAFLGYLAERGFTGCPRFDGIDERGREILDYLPGTVGTYPLQHYMWSDPALVSTARLLRRFHDASIGFKPRHPRWQFVYPDNTRHDVICHNDVAPYNMIFVDELPYALIDFDTAGPGPRIWDIAYAVYRFIPLSFEAPRPDGTMVTYDTKVDATERRRRLSLFRDAYGMEVEGDLFATVDRRLQAMITLIRKRAESGDAAYLRLIDEGHLDHYLQEVAFVQRHRQDWS